MTYPINIVHTPCKECVFAIYKEKTQVDCELNYLSVYKQKNPESVIEVYDREKEFFVINNKKCIGYREEKWFEQFGTDVDKKEIYYNTNKLDYIMSIYIDNLTEEELEDSLKQIGSLEIKPHKVILVRYPKEKSNKEFSYNVINNLFKKTSLDINWAINTVVDDIEYKQFLQNIVFANKKHRFIVSITKYLPNIDYFISKANNMICKELGSFMVLSDQEESIIVFSSIIYRYYMTENKASILEEKKIYTKI